MSELIDSLTNIEEAANRISSHADEQKKHLNEKFKKLTIDFDNELKKQTQKKLDFLKEEFDNEVFQEQTKLQKIADKELLRLDAFYDNHLSKIIDRLFTQIIEADDV